MYAKTLKGGRNVSLNYPNPVSIEQITQFLFRDRAKMTEADIINGRIWMSQCLPTILNNQQKFNQNKSVVKLFQFCNRIKFHRNALYQLVHKNLSDAQIKKLTDYEKLEILKYIINMHHENHKDLKEKLRNSFIKDCTEWGFRERFIIQIRFMTLLLLDEELTNSEKQGLLKILISRFRPSSLEKNSNADKFDFHLSKIYEMIKVFNINIESKFFQFSSESYSRLKLLPTDIQKRQFLEKLIVQNEETKKRYESIFELIVQEFLKKNGYEIENNFFLCNNEYDILVKGRVKQRHLPLKGIDLDEGTDKLSQIPISLVRQIGQSSNVEWLQKKQPYEEKIVLDLQGPSHFIDSDDSKINQTITAIQNFRYLKLPLYGIHRYNLIQYKDWEQKSKYPGLALKYIEEIIQNCKHLNKTALI